MFECGCWNEGVVVLGGAGVITSVSSLQYSISFVHSLFGTNVGIIEVGATRTDHRKFRGLVGGIHRMSGHVTVLVSAGNPRIEAAGGTRRDARCEASSRIGVVKSPSGRAMHKYVCMSCGSFMGSLTMNTEVLVSSNRLRLGIASGSRRSLRYMIYGSTALNDHGDIGIPNVQVGLPSVARGSHAGVLCTVRGSVSFVTRSFIHGTRSMLSIHRVLGTCKDSVGIVTGVRGRRNISGVSRVLRITSNVVITQKSLNVRMPRRHVPNVRHGLVGGYVLTGGPIVITARVLRAVVGGPHPAHTRIASVTGTVCCHASTLVLDKRATCNGCPIRTMHAVTAVTTRTRGSGLRRGGVRVPLAPRGASIPSCLTRTTIRTSGLVPVHTVVASDFEKIATHSLTTCHNGCPMLTMYCGRGAVHRLTLSCNIRTVFVPRGTGKRTCCFTTLRGLLGSKILSRGRVMTCLDNNEGKARASFLRVGMINSILGRTVRCILPGHAHCLWSARPRGRTEGQTA